MKNFICQDLREGPLLESQKLLILKANLQGLQVIFMHPYITVGIWFLLGAICGYLAHKKGKNPYIWFFIGLFFGALGILALYVFGRTKKQAKKEEPHVQYEPLVINPKANPTPLTLWYYLNHQHQQCGPVSFSGLKNEIQEGTITSSTYVWSEELDNWKQIKDIPYFSEEIKNRS